MPAPKKTPQPKATSARKQVPREMLTMPKRLKKAIKARGWKQIDLARESDTSPDQVSRTISGETLVGIEAQTVAKWARALGVTTDWLLLGHDEPAPAVPLFADDSPGIDAAVDAIVERMKQRGIAVELHRVTPDEDSDD